MKDRKYNISLYSGIFRLFPPTTLQFGMAKKDPTLFETDRVPFYIP